MAKVTMKRSEIVQLHNAKMRLGPVSASQRFNYALARTMRHLKPVIESMGEAQGEPSPEFRAYANLAAEDGADVELLNEQYADVIEAEEARVAAWKEFLEGEEEVELHMVDSSEVPDLPVAIYDDLFPMIREPAEEQAA